MEAQIVEEVVTDTALSVLETWAIVSDTDRVNREAGLAPMTLTPTSGRGAVRFVAETVIGPFRVAFEELPFEWTAPERLVIRRRMTRGPARALMVRFEIGERAGGARVKTRIEVELVGRRWMPAGTLLARWVAGRLDRAIARLAGAEAVRSRAGDAATGGAATGGAATGGAATGGAATGGAATGGAGNGGAGTPGAAGGGRRSAAGGGGEGAARAHRPLGTTRETWAARISEGHEMPWAARLVSHVFEAQEHELVRMRPYELAREWGAEPRAVLETCLAATVAGLLELSWDLVCPSCRTAAVRDSSLGELGETAHCDQCDLTFGLEIDRVVEATFRPTRAARAVEDVRFCSGGPAMTPHVLAQRVLEPGVPASFEVPGEPAARLRLFARGGATARVELVEGAPAWVEARVGGQGITPAVVEIAAGGTLSVVLETGEPRHLKLERLEWASAAATAHDISLIPRFRERFSGDVLKPGVALAVSRVALVFTDLGSSTALYSTRGDAVAFRLVLDHFELLQEIIERRGGTIVKTIGDAVMAAFGDERSALGAACEMSAAFPAFRAQRPVASAVSLKIGMFAGPCYVVGANGILDYFGQTVNLAARLQAQAQDDEVVVTAEQWSEAEGEGWASAQVLERAEVQLKGITTPVAVVHLRAAR